MTTTSPAGVIAIEGREGKRLVAYRDSVDVWTVGVGHTGRMSAPPVTAGMIITEAQCQAFLKSDLAPVEIAINRALKVPVSQDEFDAMASLWFNVGTGYVATSAIIKRLNLGDMAGAAAGFDAYHKPASIIGRRNEEKAQFLRPDAAIGPVRASVLAKRATVAKAASKTSAVVASVIVTAPIATTTASGHFGFMAALGAVTAIGFAIHAVFARSQAATLSAAALPPVPPVPAVTPIAKV